MREKLGKVKVSVVTKSLLLSGTVVASLLIAPGTVQADTIDNQPLSMSWSNGTTQAAAITSTTKRDQADNLEQTDLHAQDNDYSLAGGAKEDPLVDDDQTTPQAGVSPSTDKSLSNEDSVDNELSDVWVNAYFEANGLQTITLPEQGTYTTDDEGVVTFTPLLTFVGQTDTVRLVKESSTGKIAYLNIYSVVTRTITDRSAEDSLPSEPQHEVGEPLMQPEKPTLTIPEHEVGEPLTQPEKSTLTLPAPVVDEPINPGKAAPKPLTQSTPVTPTVIDLPVAKPTNDKVGGDLLVPSAQVATFAQVQPAQHVEHLVANAVVKTDSSSRLADKMKSKPSVTEVPQAVGVKKSVIAMIKDAISSYSDTIMAPNDQTPSANPNDEIPSQHQNDRASVILMAVLLATLGITSSVISSLVKKYLV